MIRLSLIFLPVLLLATSCHHGASCHPGDCQAIAPASNSSQRCSVTPAQRTEFQRIASYRKGGPGFESFRATLQEGDVIVYLMTAAEKRDGLLHGNIKALSYVMMKYAHMAIVVREPGRDGSLRLYTSQGARGPNIIDGIDALRERSVDVFRLVHWRQLDTDRLREFVAVSLGKANKIFAYNFFGMVGIFSNHLEPDTPEAIGDDYMCSTAVAAALHYSGVDLDAVRCCELFRMVSPKRVVGSKAHIITWRDD